MKSHPDIISVQPYIYVGLPFKEYPENLIIKTNKEIERQQKFSTKTSCINAQEKATEKRIKKRFIQTPEVMQMNKIDREIAKILSHNARTSFSAIAKKLNTSTSHVIKRFNKLKDAGLFLKSSITVDLKKLGYRANAMVYITTALGTNVNSIHREIIKIPNVIVSVKIVGDCDFFTIVPLETFEELLELESRFRTISGVEKIQININPVFPNWPFNFLAQLL